MCVMQMLRKTGTVCLRVAEPNFIFDRICFHKIRTHMRHILLEDRAPALKQVLSICNIPILPNLLSGSDM